jgi:hypothetical protein
MADMFTVADLRARYPEITTDRYSDEQVQDAIDTATQAFERAADVAFTPRTETLTLTSGDARMVVLPRARVTSVTSVSGSTTGTVDTTGSQIIGGSIYLSTAPWLTTETLTVAVTHGYAEAPLQVVQAVKLLARQWLIDGPVDKRATQIPSADGGVLNLSTPGMFGAVFGIPAVDAALKQYRHTDLLL